MKRMKVICTVEVIVPEIWKPSPTIQTIKTVLNESLFSKFGEKFGENFGVEKISLVSVETQKDGGVDDAG